MISNPESRENLLVNLVGIPSVTGTEKENDAAVFIYGRLSELDYFKQNPSHLEMIPTPLEDDEDRPLHAVLARMMARVPTKKTVVLIGHYDVVGIDVYGDMAEHAFSARDMSERLGGGDENLLYGRGVMDMKCGVALEMELLRDYDHDRGMFGVNVIALAVPDEENTNCGMRLSVPRLAELKRSEGLEYIGGIDTEPGEPGLSGVSEQLVFTGAMGKMLTAFYCRGLDAHLGDYYAGLSSALMSAHIVSAAEASPALADPANGVCYPSWACLENRILSEGYSVTVPQRSITYFNCFVTRRSPADILREMKKIAEGAAQKTLAQLLSSREALSRAGYASNTGVPDKIRVAEFSEIWKSALAVCGEDALARRIARRLESVAARDVRDKETAMIEEAADAAGLEPPFIALAFFPPYIPAKTSADGLPASRRLLAAVDAFVAEARDKYDVPVRVEEYFAGLCDLSYLGFSGDAGDLRVFEENCPGADKYFYVPFDDMTEINMPIVNLSTCGHDAHKKTERLEKDYSLRILPELIASFIKNLTD